MRLPTFRAAMPDHRRPQGRWYGLEHLLLLSMLAILSDATSYRKIPRFIDARLPQLNALCGGQRRRAPAHTAIRSALQRLDRGDVEVAFRGHAAVLDGPRDGLPGIALDSKTLRGSCDRFQDQKALPVLSALTTDRTLILGPVLIGAAGHSHEMPAAQQGIAELSLSGRLFTLDAWPCPKNG